MLKKHPISTVDIDGESFISYRRGDFFLFDKTEKKLARAGLYTPSNSKEQKVLDRFLERRNSHLGKKKKKHQPKFRTRPKVVYPKNEIPFPSESVKKYYEHLVSIKQNTFAGRLNSILNPLEASFGPVPLEAFEQAKFLRNLDPVPRYFLGNSYRIFTKGEWQTMPKTLRKQMFADCWQADFRSMHFEIFCALCRKYCRDEYQEIQDLLQGQNIWDWFEDQEPPIAKANAKMPILAAINGMSQTVSLMEAYKGDLGEDDKEALDAVYCFEGKKAIKEFLEKLPRSAHKLIKLVSKARKKLIDAMNEGQICDAFGNVMNRQTMWEHYQATGKWVGRQYIRDRALLNRLYCSFELKIMSETMIPILTSQQRIKILSHNHDGITFQCDPRSYEAVSKRMIESSQIVLNDLDVQSKLIVGPVDSNHVP